MIAVLLVSFVLFTTTSADQTACQLPMVRGPCKALLHRYYYNTQTDSCEEFLYGGCNGNTNNFKTMDDCKNTCGKTATTQSTVSVCTLPKDVGPCDAAFPRYYFNTLTSQCDKFIWGGCLPNGNNFETLTMCQSTCMN